MFDTRNDLPPKVRVEVTELLCAIAAQHFVRTALPMVARLTK